MQIEWKTALTNKDKVWKVKISSGPAWYLQTVCNFLTACAVAVNFQWGKPMLSVPACLLFWWWRERRKRESFLIFIKNDSAGFSGCQHFQSWWRSGCAAGRAIQLGNWEFKTKADAAFGKKRFILCVYECVCASHSTNINKSLINWMFLLIVVWKIRNGLSHICRFCRNCVKPVFSLLLVFILQKKCCGKYRSTNWKVQVF